MKTSKGIVIGALACCGALAVYLGAGGAAPKGHTAPSKGGARGAGEASISPALGCDLRAGDRLGFSVEQRSTYAVSANRVVGQGAGEPSRETRVVRGDMRARVLDDAAEGGALTLAMMMDNPRVLVSGAPARDVESELATPVFFRMDRTCKILGFASSAPISAATKNLWKLTLKMAETVIPAPGTARAWKVEQSDATGTFVASYARKGANEVHRARGGYQALHQGGKGTMVADVIKSELVAHAAIGRGWIDDVRVDEHVVLEANGAKMADVETALSLTRADVADLAGGFWARSLSTKGLTFGPADKLDAPPAKLPFADRKPIEGLADKTPSALLADVVARLAVKPQSDYDAALNMLVQFIRLDPKNARALTARMRDVDDATRSVMWLGLGLAGGPEARAVLVEATQDRRLADVDRMRARTALAGVPDPDRAVTDALLSAPEGTLALGTLAHNPAVLPAEKQRILGAIAGNLDRAATPEAKATALAAIGNAGDGALRDKVAALAGDADPLVSAAAYRALRAMGGLPPSGELLDAFAKSTDGREQSAIAEALGGAKLDEAGVTRAIAMLQEEARPGVRATLVSLLGAVSAEIPAAKQALVARLRVESEPAILTLLGRFVRPSDMN